MKRFLPLVLALVMALAFAVPAFAAPTATLSSEGSNWYVTVTDPGTVIVQDNKKIFTFTYDAAGKYLLGKQSNFNGQLKLVKYDPLVVVIPCEHEFINETGVVLVKGDCVTDTVVEAACSRLGCDVIGSRVIPAVGAHNWYVIVVAATCDKAGYTFELCLNNGCGAIITAYDLTASLGHEFVNDTGVTLVERTCTVDGANEAKCSRLGCDVVGSRNLPAFGHDMIEVVVVATCEKGGYTQEVCQNAGCDYALPAYDLTASLGHEFILDTGNFLVKRTCTQDGTMEAGCSRLGCDVVGSRILPAFGHNMIEVVVAATCEQGGYTQQVCQNAGCDAKSEAYDLTGPLGHEFINDTGNFLVERTCTQDGVMEAGCSRLGCDVVGSRNLPALGHDFSGDSVVVAATCEKGGYSYLACQNADCDAKSEAYDLTGSLGHEFINDTGKVLVEGDCFTDTVMEADCSRLGCDAVGERIIPAPGCFCVLPDEDEDDDNGNDTDKKGKCKRYK